MVLSTIISMAMGISRCGAFRRSCPGWGWTSACCKKSRFTRRLGFAFFTLSVEPKTQRHRAPCGVFRSSKTFSGKKDVNVMLWRSSRIDPRAFQNVSSEWSSVQQLALEAAGRWNVRCMLCEPQQHYHLGGSDQGRPEISKGISCFCYYPLCQLQAGQDITKARSRKPFAARVLWRELRPTIQKAAEVRE